MQGKNNRRARRENKTGKQNWFLGLVLGALLTAGTLVFLNGSPARLYSLSGDYHDTLDQTEIRNLSQLLSLSLEELEHVDIALMNLICARGLTGSEDLDIDAGLNTLNKWAREIESDTQSRMESFDSNPARYDNSINLFKIVNMVLTLKNHIGVDYNQEIMEKAKFDDSRDFFLHGCLDGKKEGGCVSIPTLCVAIGRRLGYPLKLVLTREHVFFRWDDGKEVFNMEACCPGCDNHPDEYYVHWPNELKDIDLEMNGYLKSLTAAEELGLFLEMRGHCLYDDGNIADAQVMYSYAYKLMPDSLDRLAHVHKTFNNEIRKFQDIEATMSKKEK